MDYNTSTRPFIVVIAYDGKEVTHTVISDCIDGARSAASRLLTTSHGASIIAVQETEFNFNIAEAV
jgi:hypothetical protein